jgi:hypothetical protein
VPRRRISSTPLSSVTITRTGASEVRVTFMTARLTGLSKNSGWPEALAQVVVQVPEMMPPDFRL